MAQRSKKKKVPKQIALFEAPEAPQEVRMGSVERHHWACVEGDVLSWRMSPGGWREVGTGREVPVLVGVDEAGRGPLAGPVSVAAVLLSPAQVLGEDRPAWVRRVDDSKRLSEKVRRDLFEPIMETALAWSIVHIHADQIDKVNILRATFQGMATAVERVLGYEEERCEWPDRPIMRGMRLSRRGEVLEDACWYGEDMGEGAAPKGGDVVWGGVESEEGEIGGVKVLVDGHQRFDVRGADVKREEQQPIVKGDGLSVHIAAASILAKVSRDRMMKMSDAVWPGYGFSGHKGYPTRGHKERLLSKGPSPIHRRSFRY